MLFGMQCSLIRGLANAAVSDGMTTIISLVVGTMGSSGLSSPLDMVGTALWLKLLSPFLFGSWIGEGFLGSL